MTVAQVAAPEPKALAAEAAAMLAARSGVSQHDVALVMGSGWGPAAHLLGATRAEISCAELPGFLPPPWPGTPG